MSAVWDDTTEPGGRDVFHEKNPKANLGLPGSSLESFERARPREKGIVVSSVVQRLARRLGFTAEELAERIGSDTVRRTKYPMVERVEDGKTVFHNVPVIIEGERGLTHR